MSAAGVRARKQALLLQCVVEKGGTVQHLTVQGADVICPVGHRWHASYQCLVEQGRWCPECTYASEVGEAKQNLEIMQEHAQKLHGRCLSKSFTTERATYCWECLHRHRWKASWVAVRRGNWCPECGQS